MQALEVTELSYTGIGGLVIGNYRITSLQYTQQKYQYLYTIHAYTTINSAHTPNMFCMYRV